jgi:hypothetical protein
MMKHGILKGFTYKLRVSLCIALLIFSFIAEIAQAEPLILMKRFFHWEVYLELGRDGVSTYRAVSVPVDSRVYEEIREDPYLAVTYIHPKMYTFSMRPGFIISAFHPVTLSTLQKSYLLKITRDTFACTYDSFDDVKIVNDIISESKNFVEIRSFDSSFNLAVDYYSTKGLKEAMLYMQIVAEKRS